MEEIRDVIKQVLSDIEKKEEKETDLSGLWEKAAGKKAAKHTRPALLKRKRLVVNVSDSSWLYKLTLEKVALIEKFNQNIENPKKRIKELRFRIGEI